MTLPQSLFRINHALCTTYPGLDPIRLLDWPWEDVFDLVNGLADYQGQERKNAVPNGQKVILRRADDSWF